METKDKNELTPEEQWEQATLANNFIFYKVMRHHPDACKQMIELLLGMKISKIVIKNEETFITYYNAKGIRLDVYAEDSKRIIDVEIQIKDTKNLPERSRYYQSTMDIDNLKTGEDYTKLKDGHVIFICMEDIFKKGLPVYTFENMCHENNSILLGDRTWKHFFSAEICAKILKNKELKAFFELLISNNCNTKFTEKLKDYVEDAKKNSEWKNSYMIWESNLAQAKRDAAEAGHAEGLAKGRAEGRAAGYAESKLEGAVIAVKQLGASPEKAAELFEVEIEKLTEALKVEE